MRISEREYRKNREMDDVAQDYYSQSDGEALPPTVLNLGVNNNCYMRCKMCDIGAANAKRITDMSQAHMSERYIKDKRYLEFPLERLKTLVDEMAPYNPIIRTNFIEPLLYSHLRELVEYVQSKGLRFYTITNGWMLQKHAEWLVDAQINVLRVSLDGPESVHDDIRGMKGSFNRSITGLKTAIERKKRNNTKFPILGICYTISDHNYTHLVETMEWLRDEGILEHIYVNFSHLQFASEWEVAKSIEADPEMFGDLKECSTSGVNPGNVDTEILKREIATLKERFPQEQYHYYFDPNIDGEIIDAYYDNTAWMLQDSPCFLPWYCTQIDVSGDVSVRGHCALPVFGNIMDTPFMDVWNSPTAIKYRRRLKEKGTVPACNKCIGTMHKFRGRG